MSEISDSIKSFSVPIDSLVADPENARTHSEENLRAIMKSLVEFGQDQLLVVQKSNSVVRKGNGRLEAAKRLGWTEIAAIFVDDDDVTAVARAIADNRSGELARWDSEVLAGLLRRVNEQKPVLVAATGFSLDDLEVISKKLAESAAEKVPEEKAPLPEVRVLNVFVSPGQWEELSAALAKIQSSCFSESASLSQAAVHAILEFSKDLQEIS